MSKHAVTALGLHTTTKPHVTQSSTSVNAGSVSKALTKVVSPPLTSTNTLNHQVVSSLIQMQQHATGGSQAGSGATTKYQVPTAPQAKIDDERTESSAVKIRELATGKDAPVPVTGQKSIVDVKA